MDNVDKNKCLFLWLDANQFHAVEAKKRGINVYQVYKNIPAVLKAVRRLQIEFGIPFISPWLSSWKHNLSDYTTVIIHASKIIPPVVKYIRKTNPKIRIILWYWNPVNKCVELDKFLGTNCELWSFDEDDCVRFGLKYNTQYYFKDVELLKNDKNIDVFFVGSDKGRLTYLIKLKSILDEYNISNYFHITPTGKKNPNYKIYYSKRIPYDEVLKYIASCKVIVDYVSENQRGLTLRPLEALFFKKKLITNDETIVKRDFYRRENIFIIGKDNFKELPEFIYSPYLEIDQEIVERYEFENWISRFFES